MSSSAITGPVLSDNKRAPAGTAAAPSFAFNDSTGTGVYLVSPGVLGLSTAGVQRVVVDASGNVGIGTASPTNKLHIFTTDAVQGRFVRDLATDTGLTIGADNDGTVLDTVGTHNMRFFTGGTERMRIDASGNLLVGTTSTVGNSRMSIITATEGLYVSGNGSSVTAANNQPAGSGICYVGSRTTDGYLAYWLRNGALIGSIYANTGSTTYNTGPSDYRLKEEVKPFVSGLQKVREMKPVSFKWKESQKEDYGFIAHELQEVIPEAVTGQKDAVNEEGKPDYQAIFPAPAQMIATLVAAIQELEARLAALESK